MKKKNTEKLLNMSSTSLNEATSSDPLTLPEIIQSDIAQDQPPKLRFTWPRWPRLRKGHTIWHLVAFLVASLFTISFFVYINASQVLGRLGD